MQPERSSMPSWNPRARLGSPTRYQNDRVSPGRRTTPSRRAAASRRTLPNSRGLESRVPPTAGTTTLPLDALETRTIARIRWRLVPFLALLYFFAYLDRVNVGFASLQMNDAIGLSPKEYGRGAG